MASVPADAGAAQREGWFRREHRLRFGRPVIGAEAAADGWWLRWRGTAVMAVVNVTPDSFSDGGRFGGDPEAAIAAGARAWQEGASFVDVGGESSRPGAEGVGAREEIRRVVPVVEGLASRGVRVSVDTAKPEVAQAAVEAGASLVNDIGGLADGAMRAVCAGAGVAAAIVHMQGEPRTMQRAPRYRDVVAEVEAVLLERSRRALADGVASVLLDPGIGFGKTVEHNVALLRATARLAGHGLPLLVGGSRKRMIAALAPGAGVDRPDRRLPGSLALHLFAAERGAALVRVHDVAEHRQALAVLAALAGGEPLEDAEGG